jgi:hypothetical protein
LGQPSWFSRSCTPPVDAGAVDEHGVGLVQVHLLHDAARHLHEVGDAELDGRDRAGVEPAAEADDGLVLAVAGELGRRLSFSAVMPRRPQNP